MQKVTKVIRMCAVVAITCLVALVGSPGAAQEDKAVREVYQAQAMGQGTQLGKTFNVTINIERYATPEERQILLDAFKQAGSEGLYNALEKMQSKEDLRLLARWVTTSASFGGFQPRWLQDPRSDQSPDPIWRGLGEWTLDGLQPLGPRPEHQR